jgi:uncharacterized membrane protein
MKTETHLWAIGFDDIDRADQVRDKIIEMGWGAGKAGKYLILEDIAVVIRHLDGSFTFDRKPFPGIANIVAATGAGFLAGLVLAAPITGAAIGAILGGAGTVAASRAGISDVFVRDVETIMKPGSSALFVLDDAGDMDMILHKIQGLGGTVLKSNVDTERARLIQETLLSAAAK